MVLPVLVMVRGNGGEEVGGKGEGRKLMEIKQRLEF